MVPEPCLEFHFLSSGTLYALRDPGFQLAVEEPEALALPLEELFTWVEEHKGYGVIVLPYEWGAHFLGISTPSLLPVRLYGFREQRLLPSFSIPAFERGTGEWDLEAYTRAFQRLKGEIAAGNLYLANLTQRFRFSSPSETLSLPPSLLPPRTLCLKDPSAPLFLYSLSPETFLELDLRKGWVCTEPIKGTLLGGSLKELKESEKEQAEHLMVVDMCRNDLGRIALPGSVRVSLYREPLPLGYTTHLYTRIQAQLLPGISLWEILLATFPPASVTGTPKKRAVETLLDLEPSPRQYYCGSIGLISPLGRATFTLLIRTFYSFDTLTWYYGSGGGIVWDSVLEKEWEEVCLKAQPLQRFLKGDKKGRWGLSSAPGEGIPEEGKGAQVLAG